ncbi:XdhC family protein [Natranaerofaba carboxydovora]|uniref:XdhC family protein n=1 Tax=Natranaerofaba carboxydovora TaxID=2742683 RepID=UPI001F148738|nr:XdhC/CoxI family protein [Natranaerofaba carboxydovora]UMZ74779.1 putative xanthine dehydrogenase subunit A [Natranaerofaba carboxydovora]
MDDNKVVFEYLHHCLENNKPAVLATVTHSKGSTPARIGAKMIVFEDGGTKGTIGGGALEARIIEEAKKVLETKEAKFVHYDLNEKDAEALGMVCGGEVSLFVEPILTAPKLVIVGAGHISQCISHYTKLLDFETVVIDDRKEFASREKFPDADNIIADDIEKALEEININSATYVVLVTRGHKHDQIALEKVINKDAKYIGMIGSKRKIKVIFDNLKQKGIPQERLDQVYAPIGLDIGGDRPSEIAVSIVAQLIKVRYKGEEKE